MKIVDKYYEKYIYTFTGTLDENDEAFAQFGTINEIFPKGDYQPYIEKLQQYIDELDFHAIDFKSVIELDVYFYGLMFYVLFEKKELDTLRKNNLLKLLAKYSQKFTDNNEHSKSPNSKTYWFERVERSISIYKNYVRK